MSQLVTKRGSDLPIMPSTHGSCGKMILFGLRMDDMETVQFPLSQFINALEGGEYIPKYAADLNIEGESDVSYRQTGVIETTGGTLSVNSEKGARVISVRGTEAGIAASGAKIVSVGFNQIPASGISGQTATFLAVACAWGEYGKSTQNNGYLFTNASKEIVVPLSVTQNGVAVPTHVENDVTYYLPSADGEVVVTFDEDVTVSQICGHLCWSNYRDTEYAAYTESVVDLQSTISAMGGVMRRVYNAKGYIFDEIVLSNTAAERLWYRRIAYLASVKDLPWAMETITSGDADNPSTSYRFTAAVSAMKADGIFAVSGGSVSGFYTNGSAIVVDSSSISSVADLKTALGAATMKYELATPVTGTHNLTGEIDIDDFGTMVFKGGATACDFVTEYTSYWRDVLKNLPGDIEKEGFISATAIVELAKRIAAIEANLSGVLPSLTVEKLTVQRSLSGTPASGNFKLQGTSSPTVVPDFVGQEYYDTTNKKKYEAFGVSAVSDWVVMN